MGMGRDEFSRDNVDYNAKYTRKLKCPNRWPLRPKVDYGDPQRYEAKKSRKFQQCPSGVEGEVIAEIKATGTWTTIKCPICGYIGDDEDWNI